LAAADKPSRKPERPPRLDVAHYYQRMLSWEQKMNDASSTRSEQVDGGKKDLELLEKSGGPRGATAPGFGATLGADCLLVPSDVYQFLAEVYVTTAKGFVAFVRAYPDEVAEALSIAEEQVTSALPQLIQEVAKVLPKKLLEPVSSEPFGYGTLPEPD
jgi:hypothetical protein